MRIKYQIKRFYVTLRQISRYLRALKDMEFKSHSWQDKSMRDWCCGHIWMHLMPHLDQHKIEDLCEIIQNRGCPKWRSNELYTGHK